MEFDQSIDSMLPSPGIYGERKAERPVFNGLTQQRLSYYLGRVRHLQDIEYNAFDDPGGDNERAFMAALDIMQQWLEKGHRSGTTSIEGQEVKATLPSSGIFTGVKVLVWVEDASGDRFFYTVDKLKSLDLKTIQEQVAGINHLYEEYSGNEEMSLGGSLFISIIRP